MNIKNSVGRTCISEKSYEEYYPWTSGKLRKSIDRDHEGRVIKESHADGATTEYDYNGAGQLLQQKEVDSTHVTRREILYGYDDAGNLKSEQRTGVDFDNSNISGSRIVFQQTGRQGGHCSGFMDGYIRSFRKWRVFEWLAGGRCME